MHLVGGNFHSPMCRFSRSYVQIFTVLCADFHSPMCRFSQSYVQIFTVAGPSGPAQDGPDSADKAHGRRPYMYFTL
jgi:glutaredoxin-related protein